ncbi:ZirU family protein [Pseudomonas arsenicoxydans]|uniref:Invasin family protein n=1 Tax=Pseudomonas arsenicoxydans TaxID=702115 RepID=A0A502GWU6_9PSED|nr:ZirU family protein [Pseudomonas arsenicoxydans]TPG65700.1 hypothetical protein EAH78_31660 [Pseudomonas arsenicoxydans]
MNGFKLKTSRQLLGLALGFAVSASAFAAVTSSETSTVIGRAPVMAPPTVNYDDIDTNNLLNTGDVLRVVDGAISDEDGDTPVASTYSWLVDGVEVSTAATYTIASGDAGKPITLFAKPQTDSSITDPYEGLAVRAAGGTADPDDDGRFEPETDDKLVSVAISGFVGGFPQVGAPLTATASCVATCGTVNYQWQIEDSIGSGNFVDLATGPTYTPVKGDQKRKIQVVADK